ncbi:type II toxin-antitoxin system Phd/YefM family antitoxin [Pseudomonas sp. 6D_7.1_Bac1]|nr:type II toxin-antitoxin system prevent-host-death family antitoxin [Pseudomonas sp. 6D_7.1_Bac1]MCU1753167.1 type II toxin-antitoxin system prevent-host-death family antitoxin [Pseudomonas sp. 6D_7.1_Bac1]
MKRDIFSEVVEGFKCLATERQRNIRVRGTPETPATSKTSRPFTAHSTHDNLTYCPLIFAYPKNSGYICPEYWRGIMIIVPLGEAKNNLSKLVDDAASGQIITIAKHGRALARLVPVGKPSGRRIGAMKGKLTLPEDFDAPLPDEMLDAFEGTHG